MPRSARESAVIYAEKRLQPWGKWSRDTESILGLPRVSMVHKITRRRLVRGPSKNRSHLTARGKETLSFRPRVIGSMPEAVEEVDKAVTKLPANLQKILMVEYIELVNSSVEDRCVASGLSRHSRRRYGQLLECAKYSIYAALST